MITLLYILSTNRCALGDDQGNITIGPMPRQCKDATRVPRGTRAWRFINPRHIPVVWPRDHVPTVGGALEQYDVVLQEYTTSDGTWSIYAGYHAPTQRWFVADR